ncbi:DNA primase, partial [Ralstonia solanacearum]
MGGAGHRAHAGCPPDPARLCRPPQGGPPRRGRGRLPGAARGLRVGAGAMR